jgi:dimethylhistidine N-methyltransferase
MTVAEIGEAAVSDHGVERDDFARAVIDGLSKPQKELPCRFFYDEAGSALFEDITRLGEYYPTRTEALILQGYAAEIAAHVAPDTVMVEFGSGSSTKTEILLAAMPNLAAYVAIDVSPSALEDARARLAKRFPKLRVETCVGDFAAPVQLPSICAGRPLLGFFPGSTIGNLTRSEATSLLKHFAGVLGSDAGMVIGVDLKKDPAILIPAYDDAAGVTAAFNLNLLVRINRELGGNFDLAQFMHRAVWNESAGRIEMHLVSLTAQSVRIEGRAFDFRKGETIHTENSHKYEVGEFAAMASAAGWTTRRTWCDEQRLFSVHELVRGSR